MGMTLLQLVQAACGEMGLQRPGTVAGATDEQTVQMLALINAVGADVLTRKDWTALQTQAIVNVEAPVSTTGDTVVQTATVTNIPYDLTLLGEPENWIVTGNNIVTNTRVASFEVNNPGDDGLTMDQRATATGVGEDIQLSRDTYPVPADFTSFINDTQWDRGNFWKLMGPSSPQMDQWQRSGIVATGPRRWFRQVGRGVDIFRLWPPPGTNDVPGPLAYEYLSRYWAADSAGTPQADFTADSDTCVFNDRVMIEGLKWRFFAAKGFDYSSQLGLWQRQLDVAMGRDGGSAILVLNRRQFPIFISPAQAPEGNFPGMGNLGP